MDLLTPPTDNLYKFIAVAGLAVALAAGYVLNNDIERISGLLRQTKGEEVVLKAKLQSASEGNKSKLESTRELETRLLKLQQQETALEQEASAFKSREANVSNNSSEGKNLQTQIVKSTEATRAISAECASIMREMKSYQVTMPDTDKNLTSLKIAQAELDAKRAIIDDLEDAHSTKSIWLGCFSFAGGITAMTDFRLWYWRVQWIQDRLLQEELKEKMKPTE